MPGIDLAALSGADLRRLLKVAHTRHDGLLSDRLEWEIAERAAHGNRAPKHFAEPPDGDEEEPVFRMVVADPEPDPVETFAVQAAQPKPRGVWLVTLGAVAGSVLSATVFWGLERMDERAPSQPVKAVVPAPAPVTLAAVTPVETAEAAMPVEIAPVAAAPARKAHRPPVAKTRAARVMTVASAERGSRPPNLSEWLDGKAEEPIY